jgi:hypothetical protein
MNRIDKELQKMREIVESMRLPKENELTRLVNLKPITKQDIDNHRKAWNKIMLGDKK